MLRYPNPRDLRALIVAAALSCFAFASVLEAAQCYGTTRAGNRCKNQGDSSGYCHYHKPDRSDRCSGTTRDGSPCRNPKSPGSNYCRHHG